jgi:hypothetical protein
MVFQTTEFQGNKVMARYTKTGTPSTIGEVNAQFDLIATAIDDTLSRVGDTPNQLETSLDMNSNPILNLPTPLSLQSPLRLQDLSLIAAPISGASVVDNILVMTATNYVVGDYVVCKRYYTGGELVDGLQFEIVEGGTGTNNGGTFHNQINGTQAKLITNGTITPYQFGARGDNVDSDTAVIQLALDTGLNLQVPKGRYKLGSALIVTTDKQIIQGEGTFVSTPTVDYLGQIKVDADDVLIKDISFEGDFTGTQRIASIRGIAIYCNGYNNLKIIGCSFDGFAISGVDTGVIETILSRGVLVQGCFFGSGIISGKNINVAYTSGEIQILGNHSNAQSDAFAFISSVGSGTKIAGTDISVTSHVIVSNNVYVQKDSTSAAGRHGLVLHYDGGISHCVITGNIFVGGERHGIYLRGNGTVGGETGPDIVSNNIVRYFGGGIVQTAYYGYNSGIKIETTRPTIVDGNILENIGYKIDGTLRDTRAAGIDCIRACRNVVVSNNVISNVTGGGILLCPTVLTTVGVSIENVTINSNQISFVGESGIVVSNRALVTNDIKNVSITNNTVTNFSRQYHPDTGSSLYVGIGLDATKTDSVKQVYSVSGNIVDYDSSRVLARPATAAICVSPKESSYVVTGNMMSYCLRGFDTASISTTGIYQGADYMAHREFHENYVFENNIGTDCDYAFYCWAITAGTLQILSGTNKERDCDSNSFKTVVTSSTNGFMMGRVSGTLVSPVGSITTSVEFHGSTAPSSASIDMYRGDRMIYTNPSAGGFTGIVYISNGASNDSTKNKNYGAIEA